MHIVIDIPDNDYKSLVNPYQFNEHLCSRLKEIVRQGTLLPKGHGDLIDRGELKTHFIGTEQGTDLEVYLEPTIINAPPIIKADKEDE